MAAITTRRPSWSSRPRTGTLLCAHQTRFLNMLNSRLQSLVLFLALAEALFVRVLVGGWGAGLVSKGMSHCSSVTIPKREPRAELRAGEALAAAQEPAAAGSLWAPSPAFRRRMSPRCLHVVVAISVPVNFCSEGRTFSLLRFF